MISFGFSQPTFTAVTLSDGSRVVRTHTPEPSVTISGVGRDETCAQLRWLVGLVLLLDEVHSEVRPDGTTRFEFKLRVGREISWHEEMLGQFMAEEKQCRTGQ